MAKKTRRVISKRSSPKEQKKSRTLAIVALVLNILIFPGLGTLIGGKTKIGLWQFVLAVVGAVIWLAYSDIGAALLFIAWIWGIVTGIALIKKSS